MNTSLTGPGSSQSYANPSASQTNANINGNMGGISVKSSIDMASKKENNFQKLNKQSQMLYLHHHNAAGVIG